MKTFDSFLTDISLTKILNFFGYRLSSTNPKFNTYTKPGNREIYFIFNDADNDSLQIFSSATYKKISKAALFFSISDSANITAALSTIDKINAYQPIDNNANLTTAITSSSLANLLAALIELDSEVLPITKTVQFKKRIFLTPDGFFKTPLFFYHLEQSTTNRIVNYVQWNETETAYLNDNSFCFNATYYQAENKYLFITSNPKKWVEFPTIKHSPDFFQLLCHPDATNDLFSLIYQIYLKYHFSKFYVHLSNYASDNVFAVKSLTYFLNQLNAKFFFLIEFSGTRYTIQISYINSRDLNIAIAKIFSNLTYNLQSEFISGQREAIEVGEELDAQTRIESKKENIGDKVYVSESISCNKMVACSFLNYFLAELKLNSQIEVIEL